MWRLNAANCGEELGLTVELRRNEGGPANAKLTSKKENSSVKMCSVFVENCLKLEVVQAFVPYTFGVAISCGIVNTHPYSCSVCNKDICSQIFGIIVYK